VRRRSGTNLGGDAAGSVNGGQADGGGSELLAGGAATGDSAPTTAGTAQVPQVVPTQAAPARTGTVATPTPGAVPTPAPAGPPRPARPGPSRVRRPAQARSRFALANWRVRWRLAAIIAVPTAIAAILGGLTIYSDVQSAAASGRVQHLAQLNAAVVQLTQALESERDLSAGYAANRGPAGADILARLRTAQDATNSALVPVESDANGVTVGAGYLASTVANLNTLINSLRDLPAVRQDVTSTSFPSVSVIREYTINIIATANAFSAGVGAGANDAELQGDVTTLGALLRVENDKSVQQAILYAALSSPARSLQAGDLLSLNQAHEQEIADTADFTASTSTAEQEYFTNTVSGQPVDVAASEETLAESTPLSPHNGLTAPAWNGNMGQAITDTRTVANGLVGSISSRANTLSSQATRNLWIISLVTLVLLLLILLVSTVVARSLIRPLRKLRSDALDVAGHRLPEMVRRLSHSDGADEGVDIEPIGVTSTDEIGEVARAFDQVHREAVRLAADEAMLRGNLNAMFINLSRRSQSLIERQLSLIDSLEQSEQDPGRLSSLFRLDHLATRMRRNSENLLVLAGHEVTRRWSQPVPLVDVLRAAISEIEQYERVVLNVQPGIVVVGQAVNDVVHLVAEIVENATTFSPEDTQVYVSGQPLSSGGVLLDITDNGVGISDQEMSHANWRLDNPPVVDVAVSRRMGLFVVGRLAARHGVRVRLRHAQAGGLTALIWLPETVAAPEVAPPLGRLRRFEAEDFGPTPSLSAPTQAASGPTTQTARIPRFSPTSPSAPTSPNFAPVATRAGGPSNPPGVGNLGAAASRGWDDGKEEPTQALPARNGAASAAAPANGATADEGSGTTEQRPPAPPAPAGPTGPSRLPSFGGPGPQAPQLPQSPIGGQNVRGGDGPSVSGTPATAVPNGQGTDGAGADPSKITVPPTATQDQRLPIFDSLESDWFRRSGKTLSSTRVQSTQQAAQSSWTSPADEGWRAAQALTEPAAGETTQAGLPRRVPRANLVPGSIGTGGPDAEAEGSARSPDAARNRMASFQRGVREGRAAAPEIEEPQDR
jgi:signal transduction histidine kinase